MDATRLAIIGAGGHACASHYRDPGWLQCPDEVALCAACDLDEAKRGRVADEFGVPATYGDFHEMIRREAPAGTFVVLPPTLVADVACECLELGQHVVVEKPPGCNLRETQRILDTARACDRKVMCSLDRRFFPVIQLLKAHADPAAVNHVAMSYNKACFNWGAPANLFTADAIHLLDLVLHLAGPVVEVHAYASRRGADLLRSFSGILSLSSGAAATVNCHYSLPQGRHGRRQLFELTSDGFSAYLDLGPTMQGSPYGGTGWLIDGTDECTVEQYFAAHGGDPDPASHSEALNFARWIRGEAAPIAPLDQVIESVRVCEAVAAGYHGSLDAFEPVFDRTNAP